MSTRVSICMSILDHAEWGKESIASVVAQSFQDWEMIVVDDGSTEDIKGAVESFNDNRLCYFRFPENKGVPHGSNFALQKAMGDYVCVLSAGETISPDKLEIQVKYLDEHQGVDCVWGLPTMMGSSAIEVEQKFGERPEWMQYAMRAHNRSNEAWLKCLVNLEGVPIGGGSLMMKRSVMEALGYFDPALTIMTDHDLYCSFFEKGYTGIVIPYVFALDKGVAENIGSVRANNQDKFTEEWDYVKAKHPLKIPPVTGRVTIGIPCYNYAKFLPDAVASVLAQTHQDIELMILNDGSTDDFNEVVAQFTDPRIKIFAFDENRGIDAAANQMAFRATGEWYCTLAADDWIEPTIIEKCLAEFANDPFLEFVTTQTDFYNVDKGPLEDVHGFRDIPRATNCSREEWLSKMHVGNQYFGVGLYRVKALSDIGGWEEKFKVISDYQVYLKLLQRYNIRIVEENLTHTRVHDGQRSQLRGERAQELPWLYHEARKPFYRQLMRVVIATPFYELKGFSPYISSLVETIRIMSQVGIQWRFMELSGDSYVHRARNTMCDQFLADPDATDLFFVDSDMAWNPEAFVKMCLLPDPVVGGSYPVKNAWDAWTSIPKLHEEEGKQHYRGRELGDGTALVEAQVLAGGFLRIKRQVLESFKGHFPDLWYKEGSTDPKNPERRFTQYFASQSQDHQFYGEDHWFSNRMRDMGIPMMIYPNATISHFGVKGWQGNFDQFLREQKKINEQPPAGAH